MTGFLLDTNILSEFSPRGEPAARVKGRLTETQDRFFFTSVLAPAGIRQGNRLCEPCKRRAALEEWLERDLRPLLILERCPSRKPSRMAGRYYRPGCGNAARLWLR
jgi:hypothetical protein